MFVMLKIDGDKIRVFGPFKDEEGVRVNRYLESNGWRRNENGPWTKEGTAAVFRKTEILDRPSFLVWV